MFVISKNKRVAIETVKLVLTILSIGHKMLK